MLLAVDAAYCREALDAAGRSLGETPGRLLVSIHAEGCRAILFSIKDKKTGTALKVELIGARG
jgi:hypothetical protein